MTLLNTINVGGTDYGISGIAVLGACATPAGSEVKVCTFTDAFELKAGCMLMIKFTYANTYGDGSTTYPKLQINGTNYVMRRADGNYLQSGEWGNNATLTFLFDGTDFILPAGSGSAKGSGVPLGAILAIHSNQVPDGYLPCNGVQFDTAQFAALYALLGDDHTPDLREVTLRGIGHNETHVFDSTETDPSTGLAGTQNHDEYTLGQFKDDQLQQHGHWSNPETGNLTTALGQNGNGGYTTGTNVAGARAGTVTRGKSVGVNYIIKATSGLPDDQQDYILNQLAPVNTVQSGNMHAVTSNAVAQAIGYSTTEVETGILFNNKKVYKRTYYIDSLGAGSGYHNYNTGITGIDTLLKFNTVIKRTNGDMFELPYVNILGGENYFVINYMTSDGNLNIITSGDETGAKVVVNFEYTKTTA